MIVTHISQGLKRDRVGINSMKRFGMESGRFFWHVVWPGQHLVFSLKGDLLAGSSTYMQITLPSFPVEDIK